MKFDNVGCTICGSYGRDKHGACTYCGEYMLHNKWELRILFIGLIMAVTLLMVVIFF